MIIFFMLISLLLPFQTLWTLNEIDLKEYNI